MIALPAPQLYRVHGGDASALAAAPEQALSPPRGLLGAPDSEFDPAAE